jgi:RNA polymerase sigma-70 factor (TIGR02957 family)
MAPDTSALLRTFDEYRQLLFAVAYRLLGSVSEAEDVVQDTWLRWSAEDRSGVGNPRAFLATTATRLALNRVSSARARHEQYVGPWLPEPLVTAPDVAEDAVLAESVSTAMLLVLETLSPLERAVFVLRDVFDFEYAEVAQAVGRSEAAVRQLAHRARRHVLARRPRFDTDREQQRRVTERFLAAAADGDIAKLMELLAPDVAMWTDGGGVVPAARRLIHGAEKVARAAVVIGSRYVEGAEVRAEYLDLNGEPGLAVYADGELLAAGGLRLRDGKVAEVWVVRNPEKLTSVRGRSGRPGPP